MRVLCRQLDGEIPAGCIQEIQGCSPQCVAWQCGYGCREGTQCLSTQVFGSCVLISGGQHVLQNCLWVQYLSTRTVTIPTDVALICHFWCLETSKLHSSLCLPRMDVVEVGFVFSVHVSVLGCVSYLRYKVSF